MAKRNAVNLDITNNADGFDISGGTTSRKLTLANGDVSIAGSGSAVLTFPSTTETIVGRATTDTLTNKTLTSPLLQGTIDGWTSANESWTYASASTITVPSGATSKYQVGDKIKWTQTTVKYGVIVAVADTLLTIIVNNDYVVTNAAISANYYSHEENPLSFPAFFNYTSTVTGFTTSTGTFQYTTKGRFIYVFVSNDNSLTSNSATFNMTGPITMTSTPGQFFQGGIGILNNGSWQSVQGVSGIFASTNTIKFGIDGTTFAANAFGGFTASGGKAAQGVIGYTF